MNLILYHVIPNSEYKLYINGMFIIPTLGKAKALGVDEICFFEADHGIEGFSLRPRMKINFVSQANHLYNHGIIMYIITWNN